MAAASSAPGERHEHLAARIGKIVIRASQGPACIANETNSASVLGKDGMKFRLSANSDAIEID